MDNRRIFRGWPKGNGPKNSDRSNPFHEDSVANKGAEAETELVGYGISNEGLRLIIHKNNAPENGQPTGEITVLHAGWPSKHNSRLSEVLNERLTISKIKSRLNMKSTMAFLRKVLIPYDSLSPDKREALDGFTNINADEDDLAKLKEEEPATENQRKLKLHIRRERNSAKAKEAKAMYYAKCEKQDEVPACQACEENFEDKYGIAYLEAHHKQPLGSTDEVVETTTEDFDLLCANCHRAIHRMPDGSTLEDLRALLRKNGYLG